MGMKTIDISVAGATCTFGNVLFLINLKSIFIGYVKRCK